MRQRSQHTPVFEALIDDIAARDDAPNMPPGATPSLSIEGLEAAWELRGQAPVTDPGVRSGYDPDDMAADLNLDPHRIIVELGLGAQTTEADIARLRRAYALRNHPDRLPPSLRQIATERMMIVNDILDRHLARLRQHPYRR